MKPGELSYYYSKFKYGEDIFHHLMQQRVKEILLVASFFDSYVLEQDGRLSEQIYGDYRQMDLMMSPRITTVSFSDDVMAAMDEKEFDAVIIMMRVGTITPYELSRKIKAKQPSIPVLLLLNKQSYINLIETSQGKADCFDDIFLWKGDSKLFVAMIKSIEDKLNVDNDTSIADVRIALLVESSIDYYSVFLPLFYTVGMALTQELIDAEMDIVNKRLKMRARPKILLAHNYEDAIEIYNKFKDNMLCIISNANLKINDSYDYMGGVKLLSKVRRTSPDLPLLLQSADEKNRLEARKLKADFLYKFSDSVINDLEKFVRTNLGFGDFIFRKKNGEIIGKAKTVYHLEKLLEKVPDESIDYHAKHNHFSSWLIAHSEVQIARVMKGMNLSDFLSISELRRFLINAIHEVRKQQNRGKVITFDPSIFTEDEKITQLAEGSMGGKGRGLAFLNALLVTMELEKEFENTNIRIPRTAIIGTNEFDVFMETNNLITDEIIQNSDKEIDTLFIKSEISTELFEKLSVLTDNIQKPIAIRSSGLLEDSQSQPFAGIYRTFMIPNNHPDKTVRLKHLCDAVKMVFASPFQEGARRYIESINYKIEEEKMAVVIQEIVGSEDEENLFYPHFSGAAQSYNFYPTSAMSHEDGIAALAAGLGKAVVDGERAFRFCPRFPRVDMLEPAGIVENNQRDFYAVDLATTDIDYEVLDEDTFQKKCRIRSSHLDGVFKEISSIWDYKNLQFLDGKFITGPRMLTFRNQIHYEKFPLSSILRRVLEIGEISLGVPVEIEFAVTLNNSPDNPTFNLLQIRPLSVNKENINIDLKSVNRDELILLTSHGMGNGIIENVKDVVFIDPDKFDNTQTLKMAAEISKINDELNEQGKEYILIGPGRWGTSDRFLGIPIRWDQICKAKIIVEASLENFVIEASQGSHFFHNLVAMNAGYFNVSYTSEVDFINWEWLKTIKPQAVGEYFIHISFVNPLVIKIDGKTGLAIISKPLAK
jgi:Pyruvate phosphate dikinase, AMP/ATP-binding domain